MELTEKQSEAIESGARYKVLNFGRRSGKTTALSYEAYITAINGDAQVTYYAQTFGDARDIAWNIFLETFGKTILKKNQTLLEITVRNLQGGISKVSLKGWESVVTAEKGRGTENDLLLLDEVAFLRGFTHYWQYVLEPTLLTTKGRVVFSSTPNGFNDFYELSNKAMNDVDWFYLHATSYDNPHNNLDDLKRLKKELPIDSFAQEYLADFRKQEGLVFKEFNRAIHIFDKMLTEPIMDMAGVDFGFVNPAGVVRIKKDKRGTLWVYEELYKSGMTDAQTAEFVATKEYQKVYPDPENAGAIQELHNRRVNVELVHKGKDSIKKGISKMRELFKQRRLRVHKDSMNLIWEIERYNYPPTKDEKEPDELPEHKDCHLIDALRYVILMDTDIMEVKEYDQWLGRRVQTVDSRKKNPAR